MAEVHLEIISFLNLKAFADKFTVLSGKEGQNCWDFLNPFIIVQWMAIPEHRQELVFPKAGGLGRLN